MHKYKYMSENSTVKREIQKVVGINTPMIGPDTKYYVKYKNFSYRECKFISQKELLSYPSGKHFETKLRKQPCPFRPVPFFKSLYKPITYEYDEGFITIEKVISDRYQSGRHQYLVKWLSLDYDECTWEDKDDLPQSLIHDYFIRKEKFNEAYSKSSDDRLYPPKFSYLEQRRIISQFQPMLELPEYKNKHTLSNFQLDGINWIHRNWILHRNSILADEMGLGKTIQSLCFLLLLKKNYGIRGPFLILAPLSTIPNWMDEIEEWTNFRAVSLTGNIQARSVIEQYCLYYNENDQSKLIFDILILPIEAIKRDFSILKKIYFMCLIIDEAHRLKSPNTDLYHQCEEIKTDFTLLMTGTPVQNDIHELWSILHFVDSSKFSDFDSFNLNYSNKEDRKTIENLHEVIKPYILRREKSDIKEIETPIKEETIIEVEMTPFQRSLYKSVLCENREILVQNILKTKTSIKNISVELRKVCNHPYLLKDAKAVFLKQFKQSNNLPENSLNTPEIILNALIYASGKTILLDKLLPKLLEGEHKVLIFSQMTKMLDILDDYLYSKQYKYERFDDDKNFKMRKLAIERFKSNPDSFIFLLSTRAGILGLNLTEADTVIIFDNDYNPQNDIQTQALCHSIGQTKEVKVYRLIMKDTYESVMFDHASKKLALNYAILGSHNGNASIEEQTSAKEIEMMLKKGAYYIFNDRCNEHDKFCEESIDQILENRSHVINHDFIYDGNSRFSKVSFNTNQRNFLNVDFSSPDFWSNLLPQSQAQTSSSLMNDKREKRKNYQFYFESQSSEDNDDSSTESSSNSSDNDSSDSIYGFSDDDEKKRKLKKKRKRMKMKFVDDDFYTDLSLINVNDDSEDPLFNDDLKPKYSPKSLPQQSMNETIKTQQQHRSVPEPKKLTKEQIIYVKKKAEDEVQYILSTKFKQALALLFNFGLYGFRFIKKSPSKEFAEYFLLSLIQSTIEEKKIQYLNYVRAVKPKMMRKIDSLVTNHPFQIREEDVYSGFLQIATSFHEIDRYLQEDPNASSRHDIYEIMKIEIAPNIKFMITFLGQKVPSIDDIFKKIKFYDSAYRAAVYITNERLPPNFYFAPSVPFFQFPFWGVEMDFYFLCGTVIYGIMNMEHVFTDPKLPFCLINQEIFPKIAILRDKFQLILNEVNFIIPNDYDFKGKLINDYSYFKMINWRLLNKTAISWNFKKQIIRGLYFYGIPIYDKNDSKSNSQIIEKLKFVFHADEIDDFAFTLFISAVLAYCRRFQPEIDVGPFNVPVKVVIRVLNKKTSTLERIEFIEPDKSAIFKSKDKKIYEYDLRWVIEEKIRNAAKNIYTFQKVRSYYNFFNKKVVIDMNKMPSINVKHSFNFPRWGLKSNFVQNQWCKAADIKLFNITASYGFLLFSEFGRAFLNITDQTYAVWRLNEITSIRPVRPKFAELIDCLFPSDPKIDRLETILSTIQKADI